MKNVIVKKSKIHGKGVFANKDFKKGKVVLEWNPKRIFTRKEIMRLPAQKRIYIERLSGNKYILMEQPERYVNHSCEPNTYTKNSSDIAKRNIKKGEEILSAYSNDELLNKFVCRCKSKKCRGLVR